MRNVNTQAVTVITEANETIQKIPQQPTGKTRNRKTAENGHIGDSFF